MIQLKRILVPTDFSEFSLRALEHAAALAGAFGSDIHVLHVLTSPALGLSDAGGTAYSRSFAEYEQDLREEAENKLNALPIDIPDSDGRITKTTRVGPAFVEIIQYAKSKNIDLIVLGTHGRTGLKHVLLGSVAERVVRKASCPVLTVKDPGHEFATS